MESLKTISNNQRRRLIAALLAIATLAVFAPVWHSEFTSFDDGLYVTQNPHVLGGLTWANIGWAFRAGSFGNWHPLTWLSHMLDAQLYGLRPGGHHLTSLLLHCANAVVLFLLLEFLTGALWRSACVAALFAWHPLRVESVAWISERKDVLSGLFFLLTLWAYARYVRAQTASSPPLSSRAPDESLNTVPLNTDSLITDDSPRRRPRFWYGLSLALFALGLMSKPMLVTLPFVLLLMDYWPLARREFAARESQLTTLLLEKLPFFALALVASAVAYLAQERSHSISLVLPLGARLANAVASYIKYLGKTFWPVDLAVYYPHPDLRYPLSHQWPLWVIAGCALGLAAVSLLALAGRKKAPWLPVGWFWFLGMLVPVIGLVQVGTQAMADRYTYLPLIGIFICLVWGVARLLENAAYRRPALSFAAAAALLACAVAANHQTRFWHDTETLFRHALAVNPESAPAHFKLGSLEGSRGNYTAALDHFRAALRADPKFVSAYYSMGLALEGVGKQAEAVEAYQAAVRIDPGYEEAHNRLGMILAGQGRTQDACQEYAQALQANPDSADAHFNLGAALLQLNRPAEAAEQFTRAARLRPDDPGALSGLARARQMSGQAAEAIKAYQRALKLNASWPAALRGLAWLRATCPQSEFRNGRDAVRLAQLACQTGGGKDARTLAALDAAYAEAGQFVDAIAAAENTRAVALTAGQRQLAQDAEARLALYRQARPFHEPRLDEPQP